MLWRGHEVQHECFDTLNGDKQRRSTKAKIKLFCCRNFNCSSGDIGFISRRGNENKLSHFYVLLTKCIVNYAECEVKDVKLSTQDLDKELIIIYM